jgi:hypothetical protein
MDGEGDRSEFADWLEVNVTRKGVTLRRVAIDVGIDYSYLYKVANSHKRGYSQYRRPGYAYTVRLGRHFGDLGGALTAAGYETAEHPTAGGDSGHLDAGIVGATKVARESLRRLSSALREFEEAVDDPLGGIGPDADISAIAALPLGAVAASAGGATAKGDSERADGTVADILPGGVRTIRISGDCMEPEYRHGDVVLVRETQRVKNGEKVIAVARETGEVLCKQFRDDRGKGRRLEPLNPEAGEARHLGEWEYRIVGVVEGSIRIGR